MIVVAEGARLVVPPGPPARVIAWARRGAVDATALGLDPRATDLGAGLALAGATLAGAGGELIVIGDGRDSVTGPAAVAGAAARLGRRLELEPIDAGDLARVELPASSARAVAGRAFALPVVVEARIATTATLTVRQRGRELARRALDVAAGRTATALPVVLDAAGLAELEVELEVAGDPVDVTDHARTIIDVIAPGAARLLRVDATTTAALTPAALAAIDTVVLDDVPGAALPAEAPPALADFVEHGGTLLWAAGPAVAAGGAGALEPLLPLRAAAPEAMAVMLVVDRSGSIEAAGRGGSTPDAAALAAAGAALGPDDWFGAIAFDVAAHPWVELAPRPATLIVPTLPPARGGTDPAPALREAVRRLTTAPAATRRVVALITDGGFAAAQADALVAAREVAAAGIRLEVIATGAPDAEARARLDALALAGGGRVHALRGTVAGALPALRVIAADQVASGAARTQVRAAYTTSLGPAPAGLAAGTPVAQLLARAPAPDAIVLVDAGDQPLLAARAHGRGRVLAWSADLRGAWIDAAIAATVIGAIATPRDGAALEVLPGDSSGKLVVRATSNDDHTGEVITLAGSGRARTLVLRPAAAGQLLATFDAPTERAAIDALGARVYLSAVDAEHAALGETWSLTSTGDELRSNIFLWARVPLVSALLIGLLLMVIARSDGESIRVRT